MCLFMAGRDLEDEDYPLARRESDVNLTDEEIAELRALK